VRRAVRAVGRASAGRLRLPGPARFEQPPLTAPKVLLASLPMPPEIALSVPDAMLKAPPTTDAPTARKVETAESTSSSEIRTSPRGSGGTLTVASSDGCLKAQPYRVVRSRRGAARG
jgi:hypothetical protein